MCGAADIITTENKKPPLATLEHRRHIMTEQNYLSLTRFIERQVQAINHPFKLSSRLERLIETHGYPKRDLRKALQTINAKIASHYHRQFSKQAIAQVSDQILQLWEERTQAKRETLKAIEGIDVPVDIDSDYKLYVVDDLMERVKDLPEVDDNAYSKYNEQRREVLEKVEKIEELKRRLELVANYQELIEMKIGDRGTIQRNLPVAGRDELREEMAKLRIILEKLTNLNGAKKARLKALLREGEPN